MTGQRYPARWLAAAGGLVILYAGERLRFTSSPVLPAWVWPIIFILGGLGLVALAIRPDLPDMFRAIVASLVAIGCGARAVALATGLILGRPETIVSTVGVALWPLIGVQLVTLLAYWDRLNRRF